MIVWIHAVWGVLHGHVLYLHLFRAWKGALAIVITFIVITVAGVATLR